jgi:uncharacterized integral membrane protein
LGGEWMLPSLLIILAILCHGLLIVQRVDAVSFYFTFVL